MKDKEKWKKIRSTFKNILLNSPKNESLVFHIDFKNGILKEKVDLTKPAKVLAFTKRRTKKKQ